MLLNFQNVEDIKKVLDNLTSSEKLELANNIYIGRNQSDFIDSKGNFIEELDEETEIDKIDLQYLDDRCAEIFEY